jgi:hypothetical protein
VVQCNKFDLVFWTVHHLWFHTHFKSQVCFHVENKKDANLTVHLKMLQWQRKLAHQIRILLYLFHLEMKTGPVSEMWRKTLKMTVYKTLI